MQHIYDCGVIISYHDGPILAPVGVLTFLEMYSFTVRIYLGVSGRFSLSLGARVGLANAEQDMTSSKFSTDIRRRGYFRELISIVSRISALVGQC